MSVLIRVSEATYNRLVQVQRELKDQKDEHHQLKDIAQKLVLNAPVESLYNIKLESVRMDEPFERIT
jgi:phosphoribosylformylglycinamidine (FGAM) synthase PurS component